MPAGGASADSGHARIDVLAQHVEDLRHADEHRDAPRLDQPQDVVRVEAAREDDRAATIGGMLVAIDCPNMWLSGSRFRKRSG